MRRGDVHWCDLGEPVGSAPAKRRPVVVVSADAYNASRLRTVVVAALTSNTALAALPGNVFAPAVLTGLPRDSVVNVTALLTLDRAVLDPIRAGHLPADLMAAVDAGLRGVLAL